jgi:hypothetical protein
MSVALRSFVTQRPLERSVGNGSRKCPALHDLVTIHFQGATFSGLTVYDLNFNFSSISSN